MPQFVRAVIRGLLLPIAMFCADGRAAGQGLIERDARGHDRNFFIYLDGGGGGGFGYYGQIHCRVEFGRHHELSVGLQSFSQPARERPADFSTGFFVNGEALDILDGPAISYGYIHPVLANNGGSLIRLSFRAGVVIGQFSQADKFVKDTRFFTYWSWDDIRERATGIMIQPGMIITPGDGFGFSAGVYGGFYKDFNAFGVYGSVLLGHITNRNWRRPKPSS